MHQFATHGVEAINERLVPATDATTAGVADVCGLQSEAEKRLV